MSALSTYQIEKFFRDSTTFSRETCDKLAASFGSNGIITPTDTQGSQSYTLRVSNGASHFIVQFRNPKYALDLEIHEAAKETYGPLVPGCQLVQEQPYPLHVYKMTDIPGDTFLVVNSHLHLPNNFHLLSRVVEDFATFSASAWYRKPAALPAFSRASIQADYRSRLARIAHDLPSSFTTRLNELQQKLPSLFADGYPMVINHWDLLENNIHVDIETGHLTGIVDWRDAKVGPFAMQIWGLENIVGIRKTTGMSYHPRHAELRKIFWDTLFSVIGTVSTGARDNIRTANMIGIFLANGDFAKFPADERKRELAVLQSVVSSLTDVEV